jgi:hypothetical protein
MSSNGFRTMVKLTHCLLCAFSFFTLDLHVRLRLHLHRMPTTHRLRIDRGCMWGVRICLRVLGKLAPLWEIDRESRSDMLHLP